jgi:hypothetical protein
MRIQSFERWRVSASGIWLSNLAYKFVVKSLAATACASGSTIRTEDNITQGNT